MGYDVSFHPISSERNARMVFCASCMGTAGTGGKGTSLCCAAAPEIWNRTKRFWEDLEELWCDGQLAVLKKALTAAAELGVGLLEATEVVEPNPIAPNESTSYSNLYHCDRDGMYLYIDMAIRQIAQAMGKNTDDR